MYAWGAPQESPKTLFLFSSLSQYKYNSNGDVQMTFIFIKLRWKMLEHEGPFNRYIIRTIVFFESNVKGFQKER